MSRGRGRHLVPFLVEWALLWGLWIVFAGSASAAELAIGLAAAVAATAVSRLARATRLAAFRPRPAWLLETWRLPFQTLRDSALLVEALRRRLIGGRTAGRFHEVPFDVTGDDPASAAYRAVVIAFRSVPPNLYVIATDASRGTALVHELVPAGRIELALRERPR